MTTLSEIVVRKQGDPSVFTPNTRPLPPPGAREVLLEQRAVGVNFVDLNHRAGTPYPIEVPFVPGIEAVGRVLNIGDGVDKALVGRQMGYAGPMPGAYASHAIVPSEHLIEVSDDVDLTVGAAMLMQGMTAWYLANLVVTLTADDIALVHAAATGVGRHLTAFLARKGVHVIGTSRAENSRDTILASGAKQAIIVDDAEKLDEQVEQLNGVKHQVTAVFDSVGGRYTLPSLRTLRSKGLYVNYGLAGGMMPPIEIGALAGFYDHSFAGSLRAQWASMGDYLDTPSLRQQAANAVFAAVKDGTLALPSIKTLALQDAAKAHELMETRAFDGKLVLLPQRQS
ncbi:MAG: zinc-binding dehydrogenase [Pseudomonadota bacterium]